MPATKHCLLFVIVVLGLSSCGPGLAFPPPVATPADDWTIRLTRTGGFDGGHRVIEVTSSGQLTAEDKRTGRTVTRPVSEARLTELQRLVLQAKIVETDRVQSRCADCFIYELEITSSAGRVFTVADDTTLEASGAAELIRYLGEMRDAALSMASWAPHAATRAMAH